jgi:mRNA interferase RelE/StbE
MWLIKLHRLVLSEDFKRIDDHKQKIIINAIKKKLSLAPKEYGAPLLGEFKNYWKLKVDDYRVIYRIVEDEVVVLVVKIGIRRDNKVYEELLLRIKRV